MKVYITVFGQTIGTVHKTLDDALFCSNHASYVRVCEAIIDLSDSTKHATISEYEYKKRIGENNFYKETE